MEKKELSIQEMVKICKKHETCQGCELNLGLTCLLYSPETTEMEENNGKNKK